MVAAKMKGISMAALAVILALSYHLLSYWTAKQQMYKILEGLRALETSLPSRQRTPRVAVGLGGCMDVFIDAADFLKSLNATPSDGGPPPQLLNDQVDLEKCFAYHFKEGIASERYLNYKEFQRIVDTLRRKKMGRWALGGNAPVMGNRFAKEGCQVLLGSESSPEMQKHFHQNMSSVIPNATQGDVHIIMEYKVGDKWGSLESPRANRFIFHGDQSNPHLGSLEEFGRRWKKFKPDLLVIGGLQMMDNFPFEKGERTSRLKVLSDLLKKVPKETLIHFEMASFAETELLQDIVSHVIPYVDSLGMNEQELPNLESMLTHGRLTLAATAYPRTALMLDQVRRVFAALDADAGGGRRRLSRVHLHTLGYQVVAVRTGAGAGRWRNTRVAAATASLTANRHTCGLRDIDIQRSKVLIDDSFAISAETRNSPRVLFNATEPVSCWHEGTLELCVAPVLVCTQVLQTAGGGDNISAATLAVQL